APETGPPVFDIGRNGDRRTASIRRPDLQVRRLGLNGARRDPEDQNERGERARHHFDALPSSSKTMTVSMGSRSFGSDSTAPSSLVLKSTARPPLRSFADRMADGSGGSSSDGSAASSTCTYTRLPFRVVT